LLGWGGMGIFLCVIHVTYFVTYFVICLNHMVQEGTFVRDTLALQAGTACSGNRSKAWYTPIVDLCQRHAVISRPYTKGSVRMKKGHFSSHRWVMKSLVVGTGRYLCKVHNYHDSRVCGYMRSRMLLRIDGLVWEWNNFVVLCHPFCPFVSFVHLCGSYFVIL
jgi:hypothetical protein